MNAHHIQFELGGVGSGHWVSLPGAMSLAEGHGYLWGYRDTAAHPRRAARLVRDRDGRVLEHVPGTTEVSVGVLTGEPSAAELRAAATRALARADDAERRERRRG